MSYDLKRIKVLGYTTDFQSCDCCGKENLAGTVAILNLDNDVKLHFGTTCAAKADKYDTYDAYRAAKKEINKAINEDKDRKDYSARMAFSVLKTAYGTTPTDAGNGFKVNCSECCFNETYCFILKARRAGDRRTILGEGHPIPPQFRQDLETIGLVLRVPIPAQWTGVNKYKGYK